MPLIGAEETYAAVKDGRMVQTTCMACCQALVVTDRADCVLCPTCQAVSPITDTSIGGRGFEQKRLHSFGGVGLGVPAQKYNQLQKEKAKSCKLRSPTKKPAPSYPATDFERREEMTSLYTRTAYPVESSTRSRF